MLNAYIIGALAGAALALVLIHQLLMGRRPSGPSMKHFQPAVLCVLLITLAGCGDSTSTTNASNTPTARPSPTSKPPIALTVPPIPTTPASSSNDWTTYHRDTSRAGYLASAPDPQRLRSLWSVQLDGAVYGEPLVIGGRVLVATGGNSLYSLDAQTGHILWHTNLGSPVPLPDPPFATIHPSRIT